MLQQTTPGDTACVVIEPVLGEGGYVPAPKGTFIHKPRYFFSSYCLLVHSTDLLEEFMQGVKAICKANNMLLVADEIQSGYGRTGKMFAVELTDTVPDILLMAKGKT